jgi:hypothetical protein
MADDRPRPTENDNQDAQNRVPRTDETDDEAELEDSDGVATDEAATDEVGAGETETDEGGTDETTTDGSDGGDESGVNGETIDASETDPASGTDSPAGGETGEEDDQPPTEDEPAAGPRETVPEDVRKYERFKKMDGAQYDRVNEFLRERTYITAREWAIARLCADFRTETGVEMTKIGENLPELVPFMTDTYTPQAVNQARSSFETKVRQAGATFLYGAMSGFFTAEELDDMMYEVTEVAKFLLEVEGVDLSVEEELEAEDRISGVMREVQSASEQLRHDEMECPNCGHEMEAVDAETADSARSDD